MHNKKNILKINKKNGQSIAEYSMLFVTIVVVMILAINGPIRDSLKETFEGVIGSVGESVSGLIP